jgi:peptidoglycan LD-endopeptidase CwlK
MSTIVLDSISQERLKSVHPLLAEKIVSLQQLFAAGNTSMFLRVTEGYRSWTRQQELYDQGRTMPGDKVTNAKPGYSWHQFGLAVDVVPIVGKLPDWNEEHQVWRDMISIGDKLGLVHVNISSRSGTHRDWPHFQLTGGLPVTPDTQTRDLYTATFNSLSSDKSIPEDQREFRSVRSIWVSAFPDYNLDGSVNV